MIIIIIIIIVVFSAKFSLHFEYNVSIIWYVFCCHFMGRCRVLPGSVTGDSYLLKWLFNQAELM